MVKKQGTCSKAVRRIPAPTGMEKHNCPRSRRTIYKARNFVDMILAIFLKARRSFSLSFLASLSMGLQSSGEGILKQPNIDGIIHRHGNICLL